MSLAPPEPGECIECSSAFSQSRRALARCRSWVALKRLCWITDGAVGKKSAKPAEERDIVIDGYRPDIRLPQQKGGILDGFYQLRQYIQPRISPDAAMRTKISHRIWNNLKYREGVNKELV